MPQLVGAFNALARDKPRAIGGRRILPLPLADDCRHIRVLAQSAQALKP
jgi:hypothetical protein